MYRTQEEIVAAQLEAVNAQSHLQTQSLVDLDPAQLTPLNPEIISR